MLCDHVSYVFIGHTTFWNVLGRVSFPLFAFQIAQSYIHTSNLKKYLLRLLLFACISQLPFTLFIHIFTADFYLNIFFTFILGIIACYLFEKVPNIVLKIFSVLLICFIGEKIHVDYGSYGIACVFIFYFFSKLNIDEKNNSNLRITITNKLLMCVSYFLLSISHFYADIVEYFKTINNTNIQNYTLWFIVFSCLSLFPICLYNGKKGPKIKYFFYVFYPAHLFIIWIIKQFV